MRISRLIQIVSLSVCIAVSQYSCSSGSSQAEVQSAPNPNQPQAETSETMLENPPETESAPPSSAPVTECSNGKTPKQMGLAEYTKLVRQSIEKVDAIDPKTPLTFPLATKCPTTVANRAGVNRAKPVKRRDLRVVGYYSPDTKKVMPFYSGDLSTLLKSQLRGINQQKLTELSQPPNGKASVLTLAILDVRTGKTYLTRNVALVGVYRDLINAVSNDQLQPLAPEQRTPQSNPEPEVSPQEN